MQSTVDRDGRVPIYHQVAMSVEHRIAAGEWELGDRLPSEQRLAEHYGVSRTTMRQALTVLERDHLIVRQRPSGTFVALRPEKLAPTLSIPVSFIQTLNMSGHDTAIEAVTSTLETVPSAEIAATLGIGPESQVTRYDRVMTVDGALVARVYSLVPEERCPGLHRFEIIENSIHKTIREHFGIVVQEADHWIEAMVSRPPVSETLDVRDGSPLLTLTSVYYDQCQNPIEHVTTYWLADIMKLHLHSKASQLIVNH